MERDLRSPRAAAGFLTNAPYRIPAGHKLRHPPPPPPWPAFLALGGSAGSGTPPDFGASASAGADSAAGCGIPRAACVAPRPAAGQRGNLMASGSKGLPQDLPGRSRGKQIISRSTWRSWKILAQMAQKPRRKGNVAPWAKR